MSFIGSALSALDPSTTTMKELARRRLKKEEIPSWQRRAHSSAAAAQFKINNIPENLPPQIKEQQVKPIAQGYQQDLKGLENDVKRYMKRYNFWTQEFPQMLTEGAFMMTPAGPFMGVANDAASAVSGRSYAPKTVKIEGEDLKLKPLRFGPNITNNPKPPMNYGQLHMQMSPYLRRKY